MRLAFTPTQIQEIEEAARKLAAGTLKYDAKTGEAAKERLRVNLYKSQLALRGWKSHPPRQRGYLMLPDCAKSLLLECRAIRKVAALAGVTLERYRD